MTRDQLIDRLVAVSHLSRATVRRYVLGAPCARTQTTRLAAAVARYGLADVLVNVRAQAAADAARDTERDRQRDPSIGGRLSTSTSTSTGGG